MTDLLSCPFCGASEDDLMFFCDPDEGADNSGPSRRIQCSVCNVEAPFYDTKAEAIAAWNTRSTPSVPAVAELSGDGLPEVETFARIGEWADATFGLATPQARIARAGVELIEAAEATPDKLMEEIADVVICLIGAAHSAGGDLQAAINAKMAINRARNWSLRGDGTGYHIPAARPSPVPAACKPEEPSHG